jgi:lactoylglutathione lyase
MNILGHAGESPRTKEEHKMGTRFDMIGVFVKDLKKMVAFYRDVLGLEIEWDGNGPYAEFKHAGIRFAMYERAQLPALFGQAPTYPSGLNGTFELAIDLPHFEDVDVEFERVIKAGAKPVYAPCHEPWGQRSSMLADPEGNLIEIGSWNKGAKS